jgi:hypothetical protein
MKKRSFTQNFPIGGGFFSLLLVFSSLLFTGRLSAQLPCNPAAEFSYDKSSYCKTGNNPVLSHITGSNGKYSFSVVSGGPNLALDSLTGAVNLAGSAPGIYNITNTVPSTQPPAGTLIITGVVDGDVTGGLPKAVEFYALSNIPNLGIYGFGSANNGGGTDGKEFTFPSVAVTKGTTLWVATDTTVFKAFFGFAPTYFNSTAPSVNGDDAIELFCNGTVIDVFGEISYAGSRPWFYTDGWAYRKSKTDPDGSTFVLDNWTIGLQKLDNALTNATAPTPFPIKSYQAGVPGLTCTKTLTIVSPANLSTTLACNDMVQASLDTSGVAVIGADMVLEGGPYGCYDDYIVEILNPNGSIKGNKLECKDIGSKFTVRVTDPDTGNKCWGKITVEDKLAPVITCKDITVNCTDDLSKAGGVSAFDNCDTEPDIKKTGELTIGNICDEKGGLYIVSTYIAVDDWGNTSAECTQKIRVKRVKPVKPRDIIWKCEQYAKYPNIIDAKPIVGTVKNSTIVPDFIEVTGTDEQMKKTGSGIVEIGQYCNYQATYKDQKLESCGNTFKIVRAWTILDWCTGEVAHEDQVIKVIDDKAPLIEIDDYKVSANVPGVHPHPCKSTTSLKAAAITDNCNAYTVKIFTPIGEAVGGKIPAPGLPVSDIPYDITYVATDDCGNQSSKTVKVTVVDDIVPTAICDEHTDVNLSSDGRAVVFAQTLDDGTWDNCCLDRFEVRRMSDPSCKIPGNTTFDNDGHPNDDPKDPDDGKYVTFCCEDIGKTPVVVFRAFDCSGNYNECMVEVTVHDKIPPMLTCPPNKEIDCDLYAETLETQLQSKTSAEQCKVLADAGYGDATASDNCTVTVTCATELKLDQCLEGKIIRTWNATDPSGNKAASCKQEIWVDHVSDWVVEFPVDTIIDCTSEVPDFGEPEIFFETCELVAVSYEDVVYTVVPDACYKIARTWTVINWCVVGSNIDQEVVEASEEDLNIDLDGDGDKDPRTFRDSWTKESKPGKADAKKEKGPDTDADSDPWDGYITYQQIIKVKDEVEPVFVNGCKIPDVCINTDECNTTITLPKPDVDDCAKPHITLTAQIKIGGVWKSGFGPYENVAPGTYEVRYVAQDNCNNQAECLSSVTVKDCKNPTPYCDDVLIITLMNSDPPMVQIWAKDFDEGSFDNCTPSSELQFSFSTDVNEKGLTYDCSDNPPAASVVNVWVTDAAGNRDYCQVAVIIEDNLNVCNDPYIALGGAITDEANRGVQDVEVHLNGSNTGMVMTDLLGSYKFGSVAPAGDFTIVPAKDIHPLNGVSTFDLVLISKHILGVQPLDSPCKIIAADANRSNSVTTFDLVELRKLILFINEDLPNNTSWRFVKKDFVFPNPANPWQTVFPEVINMNNVTANDLAVNFFGIKIGDVNGNAIPNQLLGSNEDRNTVQTMQLFTEDRLIKAGETFTIPVSVANSNVSGFQFTLNFDPATLEFIEIVPSVASEENFGFSLLQRGAITASWIPASGKSQLLDGELFGLAFTAKKDGRFSDLLELGSRYTKAEAYNNNLELMDISLQFDQRTSSSVFNLYQNTPNPFNEQTVIGFQLGEAARATLTLTDVSGRVVKVVSGDYPKGYNEIRLKRSELNVSGVLYYRLETENFTATRKMILMD